jgi:hypothetical protein
MPKGNAVTGSLAVASNPQLTATGVAGGPFTPAASVITLTNAGDGPLTWALLNPTAVIWLKVSPAGGALNPNAATNLSVTFTTAAKILAVGNYSASFKFTNLTSTAVQLVSFQLQVVPAVSVQPDTGFTASGTIGGPFIPATQNFTISNLGSAAVVWKVAESSKWLAVKLSSGTVTAGGQSKFTLNLTAKANKLAAGTYQTTVIVRTKKNKVLQTLPVVLSIGAKPVAAANLQAVTRAPASLDFTFATTPGTLYQVQYKTNLMQPDWMNLGGPISAESGSLKFTDATIINYPQKFYRLIPVP